MITKTIATTIAALTLLTSSALAADIVRKAPPKVVEAAPASCFDLAVGGKSFQLSDGNSNRRGRNVPF